MSAESPPAVASGHNPIFSYYVNPELSEGEQLEGIVAYGLYKIAKREWAAELWHRENRKPTAQELTSYITTWTKSQLDGKSAQAETILAVYANSVVQAATPEIVEKALRGTFWEAAKTGFAVNLLYTLFLLVLAFILSHSGVDLVELLQKK